MTKVKKSKKEKSTDEETVEVEEPKGNPDDYNPKFVGDSK